MRVRDLGPLLIEDEAGEHGPGGQRPGLVLARLIVAANHRVSVDALIDAAWRGEPGARASATLETHIWRLRQILEPNRAPRTPSTVLVNDTEGYRLIVDASSLDSMMFETLAVEAHAATRAGDHEAALTATQAALRLWRGQPYEPYSDADWAAASVARLTSIRAEVAELQSATLIELGRPQEALAALEQQIAESPLREGLWAQRMLALFRLGRSDEALRAYQEARHVLLEEVGLAPGKHLQELQAQILRQDSNPGAGPAPHNPARTPARAPMEVHLPVRLGQLVGRGTELERLTTLVTGHALVTITGAGGCGKTRLSIEVGRAAAHSSSDGVWFVDLTTLESADKDTVAELIVSTIGFEAIPGSTAAEALQSYLAGKHILLVLDNCEHVLVAATQAAEAILDGAALGGAVRVLATSREPLGVDGEIVWTLGPLALPDTSSPPAADVVEMAPAMQLFLERAQASNSGLMFNDRDLALVRDICVALDGLPLALELAAARVRSYSLAEISAQARADPTGIRSITDRGHHSSLEDTIEWSHRALDSAEQVLHRRLAVLPGPFVRSAASALADGEPEAGASGSIAGRPAADVLDALVHRSMIATTMSARTGATLFHQLIPIRAHAEHQLRRDENERLRAAGGRDRWVHDLVSRRPLLGHAGVAAWCDEVEDSYATVRAALQRAADDADDQAVVHLCARLAPFWFQRGRAVEAERWLQIATTTRTAVDVVELNLCHLSLAAALSLRGGGIVTTGLVQQSADHLAGVGQERRLEVAFQVATIATQLWWRAEYDVMRILVDVIDKFAEAQDAQPTDREELVVLRDALWCTSRHLDLPSVELFATTQRVYQAAVGQGNLLGAYFASATAAWSAFAAKGTAESRRWLDRTIEYRTALGGENAALYLENRSRLALLDNQPELAVQLWAASERESTRAGMPWPVRADIADEITKVKTILSEEIFEQAWRKGSAMPTSDFLGIAQHQS